MQKSDLQPPQNAASIIRKQLDFQCIDCSLQYDTENHQPFTICSNNHSVCRSCLISNYLKKPEEKCRLCEEIVTKSSVNPLSSNVLIEKINSLMPLIRNKDIQLLMQLRTTQTELTQTKYKLDAMTQKNKKLSEKIKQLQESLEEKEHPLRYRKKQIQNGAKQIKNNPEKPEQIDQQREKAENYKGTLKGVLSVMQALSESPLNAKQQGEMLMLIFDSLGKNKKKQ